MTRPLLLCCLSAAFVSGCSPAGEHVTAPAAGTEDIVYTNRLIDEKSPYLLQHAHNPVDWYPWGDEAFDRARREDKPVFLSIGYSTCHWCHVMEEESFSDPEIAGLINRYTVPVKVDREERPDIDKRYMDAVVAMTGSGGWPLNVFLTHDRKPFYGGTYFPPEDRWGAPGLKSLLPAVSEAWKNNRGKVLESGEALVNAVRGRSSPAGPGRLTPDIFDAAYRSLSARYDGRHAGFGVPQKFPMGHGLSFLLRYWKRTGDEKALSMAERTLQAMADGGIYDHIGGGLHRYAVDARWRVPHFEKMLYDQAVTARAYLEAYQATGRQAYAGTARGILDYVLRDMTAPEGAFYAAEDADSAADPARPDKKSEGAFYLWTRDEVRRELGEKADIFCYVYGIEEDGNAPSGPHGEFRGRNILYKARTAEEAAARFGLSTGSVESVIADGRKALFAARGARPRPQLDDKILADWNGLMISTLSYAAQALDEPRYADAAAGAAGFILEKMVRGGRLFHRYREGDTAIPGFLDDYAFFASGLCDLYEATFRTRYLGEAARLTDEMTRLFAGGDGAFFMTAPGGEEELYRAQVFTDAAVPAGNSVAALLLVRMGRFTMDRTLEERAQRLFDAASGYAAAFPGSCAQLLIAYDFAVGPSREIVIAAARRGDPSVKTASRQINGLFLPGKVVLLNAQDENGISAIAPFTGSLTPIEGKVTVYICEGFACGTPVTDIAVLKDRLAAPEKIFDDAGGT